MMIVKTLLLDMAKGIRNWVQIINGCRSWAESNPLGETLAAHYHMDRISITNRLGWHWVGAAMAGHDHVNNTTSWSSMEHKNVKTVKQRSIDIIPAASRTLARGSLADGQAQGAPGLRN
jgi:hypothetical protein